MISAFWRPCGVARFPERPRLTAANIALSSTMAICSAPHIYRRVPASSLVTCIFLRNLKCIFISPRVIRIGVNDSEKNSDASYCNNFFHFIYSAEHFSKNLSVRWFCLFAPLLMLKNDLSA